MHSHTDVGRILARWFGFFLLGMLCLPAAATEAGEGSDSPSVVGQVASAVGGAATDAVAGVYILFDHNLANLNKLIKNHQFDEAEAYYQKNKETMDKVSATKKLLTKLSQELNDHYAAGAPEIIAKLQPLAQGIPDVSSWAGIKEALQQGRVLVAAYDKVDLLHEPAYRSGAIVVLTQDLDSSRTQWVDGVAKAFAQYSQDAPDFFDRYPVSVDAAKKAVIVEENRASWLNRLAALNKDKALALIKAYGPMLHSDVAQLDLSVAYVKALAAWGQWSSPLQIDKVWSLGKEFRAAGIDEKLIPYKRAVLIITGTVPGPAPAGWSSGCTTEHVPCLLSSLAELDQQISDLSTHGYSYFLIIDPTRRASIDTWQLVSPDSEHVAGVSVSEAPAGTAVSLSATVQRNSRQQVGVYFLDALNKIIYRSRMDAEHNYEGRIDAPGNQAEIVMAKLRQSDKAVLEPAEKIVPALLDQPISAVILTAFNITQQISEDAEIFQHENLERQQQVADDNAHIATLMGLSIESAQDKTAMAVTDLKLPGAVDCSHLRELSSDSELKPMWTTALGTVGRVKDGVVQNSFVLLESTDDLTSLRESLAKDASNPELVLTALRNTAVSISKRMALLRHIPVSNTPSNASEFLAVWLNQYVTGLVAAHAEKAIPRTVSQLYLIYHDIHNQIALSGTTGVNSILSLADEKLKDAAKLLVQDDTDTVQELNAVSTKTLSAMISDDLLTKCGHN